MQLQFTRADALDCIVHIHSETNTDEWHKRNMSTKYQILKQAYHESSSIEEMIDTANKIAKVYEELKIA